ncbi:MAG: YpdA family putative bacillithiol disulfide reductase [Bacteroidetes bacterium]|nr:YpdA family putative bacillithiol disulfide reductase [Bacteroidota bacterium]
MSEKNFDIVIIGAGPAGLSAAIEAAKSNLSFCVIEKGSIVNSIQYFPAGMTFFSTPELLEIGELPFTSAKMRPTRTEGLEYYTRVAEYYKLNLKLFEKVVSLKKKSELFEITTSKDIYRTRFVIIATGYYDNPNLLGIPGEELSKVSHFYNEPYQFFHQKVLVIGAKNSAAIAALELFRHGAEVTLVHRGSSLSEKIKYWILPDLQNRIKEGSITAYFNTTVEQIELDKVHLKTDRHQFSIENDIVFALTGYHPDYEFLRTSGIELDNETFAPLLQNNFFETNVNGIFVAGSIVAGKNNNSIFIENGRMHGREIISEIVKRILK